MERKFCGVWGHLREEYLKNANPEMYDQLQKDDTLEEYLNGYQIAYSDRAEQLAKKLSKDRGITEELYEKDSLEWILETEKIQEEVKATLAKEIQQ